MIGEQVVAGLMALAGIVLFFFFLMIVALYVYTSFAFTAIGKKAKLKTPELAWIPFIGPTLISFQASKTHWWPWLLIIGMFIPVIGLVFSIAFAVFSVIWQWKMFEAIKKPGWWALLCLLPIVNLVLYGVAAWGKK